MRGDGPLGQPASSTTSWAPRPPPGCTPPLPPPQPASQEQLCVFKTICKGQIITEGLTLVCLFVCFTKRHNVLTTVLTRRLPIPRLFKTRAANPPASNAMTAICRGCFTVPKRRRSPAERWRDLPAPGTALTCKREAGREGSAPRRAHGGARGASSARPRPRACPALCSRRPCGEAGMGDTVGRL